MFWNALPWSLEGMPWRIRILHFDMQVEQYLCRHWPFQNFRGDGAQLHSTGPA